MKRIFNILLAVAVVILFSNLAYAAEHPGESAHEHTGSPDKAEHKEHPGKTHVAEHPGEKAMLSARHIIKGIKSHIFNRWAGQYDRNQSVLSARGTLHEL